MHLFTLFKKRKEKEKEKSICVLLGQRAKSYLISIVDEHDLKDGVASNYILKEIALNLYKSLHFHVDLFLSIDPIFFHLILSASFQSPVPAQPFPPADLF